MQKTQTEAFEKMLKAVLDRPPTFLSPPPAQGVDTSFAIGQGTFTLCTARFGGDADESAEAFLDAVKSYKDCANVSDQNALRGLSMLLTNNAAIWWQGIKKEVRSWVEATTLLENTYGDRKPPHRIYIELFNRHQGQQNTDIFVANCRALLSKIPEGDITIKAQLDMVYGLLDRRVRKRLRRDQFKTFEEMLRLTRSIEETCYEKEVVELPVPVSPREAARHSELRFTPRSPTLSLAQAPSSTPVSRKSKVRCGYCKIFGHGTNECVKLSTRKDSKFSDNYRVSVSSQSCVCTGCGTKGVVRSQCKACNSPGMSFSAVDAFHKPTVSKHSPPTFHHNTDINNHACCHKRQSHTRQNEMTDAASFHRQQRQSQMTCCCLGRHSSLCPNHSARENSNQPAPYINKYFRKSVSNIKYFPKPVGNVNKYFQKSVPNVNKYFEESNRGSDRTARTNFKRFHNTQSKSRSDVSDFSRSRVKPPSPVHHSSPGLVNAPVATRTLADRQPVLDYLDLPSVVSSAPALAEGVTTADLPGKKVPVVSFSTSDMGMITTNSQSHTRPILRIQVLDLWGTALIDTAAKCSVAGHKLYKIFKEKKLSFESKEVHVKLADGIVSSREIFIYTVDVTLPMNKVVQVYFVVFPEADNNDTLLGIDVLRASGLVIDFAASSWHFSGSCETHPLEYEEDLKWIHPIAVSSMHLRDDEGPMLTCEQRQQLTTVLQHHEDIFKPGGEPTSFAEHHIDTGDHQPIAVPPYRLTPAKRAIMEAEINKMLEGGVIEECESAWAAPAILVPKKDGTYRFCVDYRRLNAITKSDTYPLPVIDDLLHSTKRVNFISTIDLWSSYWQVAVTPADRDKTAFTSPSGTYRFIRMPFGLKNAPATFQRLIDRFRSGSTLKDITLLAYLDDLLVLSDGFDQHLKDLEAVFNRLRVFGLHANRAKCSFACEQVKYLGHLITPQGIMPDQSKINAILQMKEPVNLKHLKSFLQTSAWFRKFVPEFSAIAQPLTKLTRKSAAWTWGEEQQHAFLELKKRLTSAPVLVQPDYSRPFVIRTDASNYALGAVLLQGEGLDEHPIEYSSRLLTSAERGYSTTEREALAVVWAVEKFRPYIDGHPVVVRSDHQPLKWLLSLKSPSGRLMRWALKLQAFDIRYEYTPGKANVVADTLSRPNCEEGNQDQCGVCSVILDVPHINPTELRSSQLDDPEVSKIIHDLENTTDPLSTTRWLERGYILDQGVLYRHGPNSDAEEPQLVIPASKVEAVLKEFHDAPTAGHQGIDRTLDRIRQRYFFFEMRKRVSEYLKNCVDCQRYKYSNQKPAGLLQTPVLNQRGEVLAVDLFGPLPEATSGEKWVLLVEDTATRWVDLYALQDATGEACARILLEEYFLRYGFPRRVISDNGVQFISAAMQLCMYLFGIKQNLIPLYHPEANPAERKNRDLKTQLSILVKNEHRSWPAFLPQIRFSLNSATCSTTGLTPSYMTFGRELRTPFDVNHDLRAILKKEAYIPQVTPYLDRFVSSLQETRERVEKQQDLRKGYADASRRSSPVYKVGDPVLVTTHALSNAPKGHTRKFMPLRDGPYFIKRVVSPTTYEVADGKGQAFGHFHSSDLSAFVGAKTALQPIQPRRLRGRPRKVPLP